MSQEWGFGDKNMSKSKLKSWNKNVKCHGCQIKGHIRRYHPNRKSTNTTNFVFDECDAAIAGGDDDGDILTTIDG